MPYFDEKKWDKISPTYLTLGESPKTVRFPEAFDDDSFDIVTIDVDMSHFHKFAEFKQTDDWVGMIFKTPVDSIEVGLHRTTVTLSDSIDSVKYQLVVIVNPAESDDSSTDGEDDGDGDSPGGDGDADGDGDSGGDGGDDLMNPDLFKVLENT